MSKSRQLLVLNVLLFTALLIQATMVMGHDFIPRDVFFPVHVWNGRILILLAFIHLFYNWGWVKNNVLKIKK